MACFFGNLKMRKLVNKQNILWEKKANLVWIFSCGNVRDETLFLAVEVYEHKGNKHED